MANGGEFDAYNFGLVDDSLDGSLDGFQGEGSLVNFLALRPKTTGRRSVRSRTYSKLVDLIFY